MTWARALRKAVSSRFYDQRKHWRTLAAIGAGPYERALEIGCSVGLFTRKLAPRCKALVALDYSPTALERARVRCQGLPHVSFLQATVPAEFPEGPFDLIVLSEIVYYLSPVDFLRLARSIQDSLSPEGRLVMVHYRAWDRAGAVSTDFAHDWFVAPTSRLRHIAERGTADYRLDVFEKATA